MSPASVASLIEYAGLEASMRSITRAGLEVLDFLAISSAIQGTGGLVSGDKGILR